MTCHQCDLSCGYCFSFSHQSRFSVSVFSIFLLSFIKFCLLTEWIRFQVKSHCSYSLRNSQYNANELHHQSSSAQNWKFYDVCLNIYCIFVGGHPSTSCTRYLIVKTIFNENRNYICLVSVVNFSVSFSFLIFFCFGLFVHSLRAEVQPTLDPSAETFMSVQCASPGRGGESVGVCGVCARCVGWRKPLCHLGRSSVSAIINRIKFYPLAEWIRFR